MTGTSGMLMLVCMVFACDTVVRPLSLYLNVAEGPEGDGSECLPLRSLCLALARAGAFPSAVIVFLGAAVLTAPAALSTEVALQGQGSALTLQAPISVSVAGALALSQLSITANGHRIDSSGSISFAHVFATDFLIDVSAGDAHIEQSHFFQTMPLLRIKDSGSQITFSNSHFEGSSSNLVEVYATSSSGVGSLTFSNCEISGVDGVVVFFLSSPTLLLQISVLDTTIGHSSGTFLGGKVGSIALEAKRSEFTNTKHVATDSAEGVTLSFESCVFADFSDPPFFLSSLQGVLAISKSEFHDLAVGPAFLIPGNTFQASTAVLAISSSRFYKINNPNYQYSGTVLFVTSVAVQMWDTEVYQASVLKSGLMSVTLGVALLTSVMYRDSSVSLTCFMDGALSDIVLQNVTMARVENNDGAVMTTLFSCTGRWDRVSVVDSIDSRKTQYNDYIVFWIGFFGVYTIRNSYIRNEGPTLISMAATSSGFLTVANTTYENMDAVRIFDAFLGGSVHLLDVTFLNSKALIIINCAQEEFCGFVSNLKFAGRAGIQSIFSLAPGQAQLQNTNFDGAAFALFYVLVAGSGSVQNVTVKNSAFVFCRECIDSKVTVSNFTATDVATYTMFRLTFTYLSLTNCTLTRATATQMFSMVSATVVATALSLHTTNVDSLGGLFAAESGSTVKITASLIENLQGRVAMSAGLISLADSELVLTRTVAQRFNATLVLSVASKVTIDFCTFQQGGLEALEREQMRINGAVLRDESSLALSISNSLFSNLNADAGGALYLANTQGTSPTYAIESSAFRECKSLGDGGSIHGTGVTLRIIGCTFAYNSAVRGGAVWLASSLASALNTEFLYNAAALDGGAVQYIDTKLSAPYSIFANNSAEYGPDLASQVREIRVIDGNSSLPLTDYVVKAASGQKLEFAMSLGLFDERSQLVVTDNTSQLTLFAMHSNETVEGSTLLYPDRGVYSVANLVVVSQPLSNVSMFAQVGSLIDLVFTVQLRSCYAGEFFNNTRCRLCTNNMYSLSPETPCKLCPAEATCAGGSRMDLSPGYWRASQATDSIHKCIVRELCLGGLASECAQGHRGVMCNECALDYFKLNQLQCFACRGVAASVVKGALSFLVSFAAIIASLYFTVNLHMIHAVIFDYFHIIRILANLNVFWPDSLGYLLVILGDIGSVGLTSFSDMCLGSLSGVQSVYSQLFVSVAYFVCVSVFVGCGGVLMNKACRRVFPRGKVVELLFITMYLMAPLLFMRAVQLFPCYHVDGVQRLIFDPSEQCWTQRHKKFAYCLALPVVVLALGFTAALLTRALPQRQKAPRAMPRWKAFHLAVFQLRAYAISSVLVLSQVFLLSSQTCITILIALATELVLLFSEKLGSTWFASLYSSTLISAVLFVFWCVIYDSQMNKQTYWREPVFVFVCYLDLSLPLLFGIASYCYYKRKRLAVRYEIREEPQDASRFEVIIENDESYRSNHALAPSNSPDLNFAHGQSSD